MTKPINEMTNSEFVEAMFQAIHEAPDNIYVEGYEDLCPACLEPMVVCPDAKTCPVCHYVELTGEDHDN